MEKKFYYYKYNEDDILEILTEYLANKSEIGSFNAKAVLLGTPGKDMRLICAISEDLDGDSITTMNDINLHEVDLRINFNGTHNQDGMTSNEFSDSIDKIIDKGDF